MSGQWLEPHSKNFSKQPPKILFQLLLDSLNMTYALWANKDQHDWLELCKAQFLEVNQRKAVAKEFFPDVVKDFHKKWPVSPVTPGEVREAGSEESATKKKHDKYDKVCSHQL